MSKIDSKSTTNHSRSTKLGQDLQDSARIVLVIIGMLKKTIEYFKVFDLYDYMFTLFKTNIVDKFQKHHVLSSIAISNTKF